MPCDHSDCRDHCDLKAGSFTLIFYLPVLFLYAERKFQMYYNNPEKIQELPGWVLFASLCVEVKAVGGPGLRWG